MENLNLNIDTQTLEQCLKSISHFGGTTYQNICTGVSNYVPWGEVNWLELFILGGLGVALLIPIVIWLFKEQK